MARTVLVYNPVSGRASAGAREAAARELVRAGWEVELAATRHGGHATDLAREAARDGVDAVVVSGGDGTVAQAVAGLEGTSVPLGIVPGGTGNQLARNLAIPRPPRAAARIVTRGRTRTIDVGAWRSGETSAPFVVACGAGFDAEVMRATTPSLKRRGRMLAYVTLGLGEAGRGLGRRRSNRTHAWPDCACRVRDRRVRAVRRGPHRRDAVRGECPARGDLGVRSVSPTPRGAMRSVAEPRPASQNGVEGLPASGP